MFIPIVPYVPNITVVNKNIVYSDTVLPLKGKGNNLKVTSISNVSEFSLEKCLKTIFESNPDVVFNTIQYSKKDKKVYFYTDQDINIKKFKESKVTKYEPIVSHSQILEEIKKILTSNKIKNSDCVSIYDVLVLTTKMYNNYEELFEKYNERIRPLIKQEFGNYANIGIYNFDYDNNELRIGFTHSGDSYDKITFKKNDNDLFISETETYRAKEILETVGTELSQLYDEFIKYSPYKNDYIFKVKPVNSNFLVDMSPNMVEIGILLPNHILTYEFKLWFSCAMNKYRYDCNSNAIIEAVKGNEDEIFKRIFVKIEDCPKWCQEELYEIRKNQLEEEQKIEDKMKQQEMKKQKRLELTRKIFSFIKK